SISAKKEFRLPPPAPRCLPGLPSPGSVMKTARQTLGLWRRLVVRATGYAAIGRPVRSRAAWWEGHGANGLEPREPGKPWRLGPKGEGVERLESVGECVERADCPEIDRDLLSQAIRRLAVGDLDIETGKVRDRLHGFAFVLIGSMLEPRQRESPSTVS